MVAYNCDDDAEIKNESCSLASVNSFPVIIPVNCQPASCYMLNSLSCKLDNNHTRRTDKFTNESSQAIAVCSSKSELSEVSSLRVSSSGTSSLKGGPSEYPEEQLKSSLNRVTTTRVCGQIKNIHNYVNSDNELNNRIPGVEVKCPDNKKCFQKSIAKVEEPNIREPPLHSQLVDNSKESDAAELEVKVCDICGDTGQEDLLANCRKCSDGAEHIYCMRIKLNKVPEGDWMCEECMLIEETRIHMQDKYENVITRVSSQSSLHTTKGNLGRSSVYKYKNSLKLCVKGSLSKKIRSKVKSNPYFSSKRSAGCLEAVPAIKQRAFKSIKQSGFPKPLDKMCLNSSFENTSKGKIKQTLDLNISHDRYSDHTLGVGHKSHKLQRDNLISHGYLSKCNSFTITDAKGEVLQMEGGVLKQNYDRKAAFVNNNVARGASRMMKSMSFRNAILDSKNASDSKVVNCYSNFSQVKDLKRLRHAKERNSTDSEFTLQFHNPLVSSLVADAGVNSLITDKKSACGKIISPLSSGSIYHDLEDSQNHGKSNEVLPSLLAIPSTVMQHDYRWKGEFEILGVGGLPHTCDGIQAHLSTCTSSKVLEVVQKLPQKILLVEVPHLNKWPAQILDNQATEDNIALYFFACDVESYERGYKDLLECMIKNDLSLKGDVDEFELLIFPSNLLPKKSQRSNKLFLWGALRGRRVQCSSQLPSLLKTVWRRSKDQSNKSRHQLDFPMSCSQHLCSCTYSNESLSAHSMSYNLHESAKSLTLLEPLASGGMSEICGSKVLSTGDRSANLQTSLVNQGSRVYHAKTEQARDVMRMDSCEREERDSKRVRMLHHSVKADSECNMDIARVAEERENKRPKCCFYRMDELHNFSDMKCSGATFSIGMNGLGSSSTSRNHIHSRAYDMPISSTNFASIDGRIGIKSVQQQTILNDGSVHFDSTFPDLELSLGFRKKSAKQRAMHLFCTEYSENLLNKHSKALKSEKRDRIESSVVPLALSLALPFSDNERVSNPYSKTHFQLPEWCGVNTSLSL